MADLGQIFTKDSVACYMVSLFDLSEQAAIMDPCFGAGSFLKALAEYKYTNVTACEIDDILFETTANKYPQYRLINGDFLKFDESNTYDGIIMNPPYIRQEKIDELESYGITKEILRSNPIFTGLPSTANMYMYFIMKAVDLLKPCGQLIVIFPSSWINSRSGADFQRTLLSQCGIEKQIHIHGEVFDKDALVDVVILKLIKDKVGTKYSEEYLKSRNGKIWNIDIDEENRSEIFTCPFSELASIRRGLTTGCNKMFINPNLSNNNADCFKTIISSPKCINGYSTLNAHLDRLLFPNEDIHSEEIISYLNLWKDKILQEKTQKHCI